MSTRYKRFKGSSRGVYRRRPDPPFRRPFIRGVVDADITVIVDELTLAGSAETITVVPGAVSQLMDELTLAGSAETMTLVAVVSLLMDELTLAGSAETVTVVPGVVTIVVNELTLVGSAETITVLAPVNPRRPQRILVVRSNGTDLLAAVYRS